MDPKIHGWILDRSIQNVTVTDGSVLSAILSLVLHLWIQPTGDRVGFFVLGFFFF